MYTFIRTFIPKSNVCSFFAIQDTVIRHCFFCLKNIKHKHKQLRDKRTIQETRTHNVHSCCTHLCCVQYSTCLYFLWKNGQSLLVFFCGIYMVIMRSTVS